MTKTDFDTESGVISGNAPDSVVQWPLELVLRRNFKRLREAMMP